MIRPIVPEPRNNSIPVTFAKGQPQYRELPANRRADGLVETKWALTWMQRLAVLFSGTLYVYVHTFNKPLLPLKLTTTRKGEF